jgi:uncharacterized protein YeaO (DUF488 family)
MELHLYTAQISKYNGPDAFDITVKSGDRTFAPTWDLVQAWKSGKIDWETYAQRYRQLMLESYRQHPSAWYELLHRGIVTLLCYCRSGEHCHRYLLADFLRKLGEKEGVTVVIEGERPVAIKDEESLSGREEFLLVSEQPSLF